MTRIFRAVLFLSASICGASSSRALDMNVALDSSEKLAYVNMWGEVQAGDDAKFKQIVTPYLRSGYLIWQVNVFSIGGHVPAAMGIGDQIRTLQTRTVTAYKEAVIHNNQRVGTGRTSCSFSEQRNAGASSFVTIKPVMGHRWCTCESACFLIWASGAVRQGGHVGIHRFYWKGPGFGNLSVEQARRQYEESQTEFVAYLKKLAVPQTIVDRLFATDSHSMYYLTWPEHQLIQSTPYLEEMTYSRCGKSKTQPMSRENNWTRTEDANHIDCYRTVLKELMRDGSHKYLAGGDIIKPN